MPMPRVAWACLCPGPDDGERQAARRSHTMEVGGELGQAKVLVQWWLDTNWWSSVEEWTGRDVCQTLLLRRLLGIYGDEQAYVAF